MQESQARPAIVTMKQPLIPYFTTSRYKVEAMLELAQPQQGEKGIDLGSGDGRIVIAFAEKGVEMIGIELNPKLYEKSRIAISEAGLINAQIQIKDLWNTDLSSYDIITIYPMPDIMNELEVKLKDEAKLGARILTNYYPLPSWKLEKTKDNIYLYKK